MLDRERGRVAGGEDVGGSEYAAVLVDGDEAVVVMRQAGDAGPTTAGRATTTSAPRRPPLSSQSVPSYAAMAAACVTARCPRRRARGGPPRWRPGRRSRAAPALRWRRGCGLADAAVAQLGSAEERKLVQRQQPPHAGRRGEGEAEPGSAATRAIACSTTPALIGPRKVIAPGTASRDRAPVATTSMSYGTYDPSRVRT